MKIELLQSAQILSKEESYTINRSTKRKLAMLISFSCTLSIVEQHLIMVIIIVFINSNRCIIEIGIIGAIKRQHW